jgi:hypothetical protein
MSEVEYTLIYFPSYAAISPITIQRGHHIISLPYTTLALFPPYAKGDVVHIAFFGKDYQFAGLIQKPNHNWPFAEFVEVGDQSDTPVRLTFEVAPTFEQERLSGKLKAWWQNLFTVWCF